MSQTDPFLPALRPAPVPARRGAGVAAILVAVALLSLSDALVKGAEARLALGQLFLARSAVACALLAGAAWLAGASLRTARPGWTALRSLCLTAMWGFYYAALPQLPFAVAAAGFYTAPLWMAGLDRVVFGRRLGRGGWAALGAGLAGVLILLRPDGGAVSAWFAAPLAAALCYALAALITGARLREDSPLALAFGLNLAMALAGAGWIAALMIAGPGGTGFLGAAWPPLGPADLTLLAGLGAALAAVTVLVAAAYQRAPAPLIGGFDNAYLVFAALWGAVLFDAPPGPAEALGAALIGGGACLMARAPRP